MGSLIAAPEIVALLGKVIPPYSIPQLTIEAVLATLGEGQLAIQRERVAQVRAERERLSCRACNLQARAEDMAQRRQFPAGGFRSAGCGARRAARTAKLLIRDMRSVSPQSLRITVGTIEQNDRLIRSLA